MIVRFLLDDLLQAPATDLIPSSAQVGFGASSVLRQNGELRFKQGWTVINQVNDGILFRIGVDFPSQIAAGYYATPAEYAEAVRVALELGFSGPVWAVAYNAGTGIFTISADVAFILKWSIGGNSAGPDLGYAPVDTGSAVSHSGGSAAYQGRHFLAVDLGSALPVSAAFVKHHNLGAGGSARFDVHNSPLDSTGGIGGAGLDYTAPLAGTATRGATFASISRRYLRFVFSDVSNPVGYGSVGIARAGVYLQPSEAPSIEYAEDSEHLSEDLVAIDGTDYQVKRADRDVFYLLWQIDPRKAAAAADLAIFAAINTLGVGGKLFVILDAGGPTERTLYVKLRKGVGKVWTAGTYWAIQLELAEAL